MKLVGSVVCTVALVGYSLAQRDLTPGSRKDAFGGAADFKEYRYCGLQISAGPTFMLTRKAPVTQQYYSLGRPYDLTTRPHGLPGVFIEAGMIHIPKKRSKLSTKLKYIFVSYIDWGVGFKLFNGEEFTRIDALDPTTFEVVGSTDHTGKFSNGFVSARATVHKNFYFGQKKKYFVDNGLGANVDFNFMRSDEASAYSGTMLTYGKPQHFHNPLVAQLHYEIGIGTKLSRRSMLILSAHTPIMGFYEWRGGAPALKWFDSNYQPLIVKLKWTYLFEKKVKGCAPAKTNSQDQEFMKNK